MIVIVWPGETELDKEKRFLGQLESNLSKSSLEDKKHVAQMLRVYSFDYIFLPETKRCMDTLDIIMNRNKSRPDIVIDPNLKNRSCGTIEGEKYVDVQSLIPPKRYKLWERDFFDAPPHGESMLDVSHRIKDVWGSIKTFHKDRKTILVIADLVVLRLMIGDITGAEETEIVQIIIDSDCPYVVS